MPENNNSVKNIVKKINSVNHKVSFGNFFRQVAWNLSVRDLKKRAGSYEPALKTTQWLKIVI